MGFFSRSKSRSTSNTHNYDQRQVADNGAINLASGANYNYVGFNSEDVDATLEYGENLFNNALDFAGDNLKRERDMIKDILTKNQSSLDTLGQIAKENKKDVDKQLYTTTALILGGVLITFIYRK